jgi:hypothetical protein
MEQIRAKDASKASNKDDSFGFSFPEENDLDESKEELDGIDDFLSSPLPVFQGQESNGSTISSIFTGRSSNRQLSSISRKSSFTSTYG